jgi:hypothetical protein
MLSDKPLNKIQLNKFAKIIKRDYPDFSIRSIKSLKSGWDNFVIEINRSYIFRFPKSKNFKLDKEIKVLKRLNGKITLEIPLYEFVGKETLYVGYKKIIGQPLSRNIVEKLRAKDKNILARDIARFFYEFHLALPINMSRKFGIKKDGQYWRPLVIKKKVIGRLKNRGLSDFIEFVLDRYLDLNKNNPNLVIAYNDLHGSNMAFDSKKCRLNGIFDFSDVAVEDVNREFCSLFSLDQKLAYSVIRQYEKLSGRLININRVFCNSVISAASILGVFINQPSSKNYRYALSDLLQLKNISSKFPK